MENITAKTFYFLRHGQTDWNLQGRLQGSIDVSLNGTGRQQARDSVSAVEKLGVQYIVTSPLKRTFQTAEIINETLQLPLVKDERLKERSFGSYEKCLKQDIIKKHNLQKGDLIEDYLPEDAEPLEEASERIVQAVAEHTQNKGENILFVGHGVLMRALMHSLGISRFGIKNAAPYKFFNKDNQWHMEQL
ncbi:MAG: histidine phosphatase family protein [Alphaproteobacteria bacterium]|nr:histidine phosphatase family protein [Alphaproteobacteria bacterium]MDD9919542.1 histidine phosphatase family protein [Alphaproteobacteria bacterium]